MKTNIIVVGLCDNVVKKVSQRLANEFGLYYADVEELIKYNLTNSEDEIKDVCGLDYLVSLRHKIIDELCNYENIVVALPVSLFISGDYLKKFKKSASTITFIDFTKKSEERYYLLNKNISSEERKNNLLSHDIRSEVCKENSEVVVEVDSLNDDYIFRKLARAIDNYIS